jgi:DTW domain-containing protein YfiP
MPCLDLKTRVVLLIHHIELKRTTNTGTLALQALKNSAMFVRGKERERLDLSGLLSDEYNTVLLYPCEDARELTEIHDGRPVQLLVPDGNWRQAAKVHTRHPELAGLARVKLKPVQSNIGKPSIRREHFAEGMATLEAIAYALATLEGAEVGDQIMQVYRAKLRATLLGRGYSAKEARAGS